MIYNAYFIAKSPKDFEVCSYYWGEERMFLCYIKPERRNGIIDIVPIIINEDMKNKIIKLNDENKLEIYGRVCTKSMPDEDGKRHLKVFVVAEKICKAEQDMDDRNSIYIESAYICKKEIFGRNTPFKVESILAINYKLNPSAYIPIVAWNKNAQLLSHVPIGEKVKVCARFQSREYIKKNQESADKKTAYELAIISIE